MLKNAAKDEQEMNENASFSSRKEFTNLLIRLDKEGYPIPDEDFEMVLNTIRTHKDFITPEYIRFFILHSLKNGRYQEGPLCGIIKAKETLEFLMSELRETRFYQALIEVKDYLEDESLSSEIISKWFKGENVKKIAADLGKSPEEISIRLNEIDKKRKPEILTDEERQ